MGAARRPPKAGVLCLLVLVPSKLVTAFLPCLPTRRTRIVSFADSQSASSGDEVEWSELQWRVQRSRLTYFHTLEILRRKPRYLAYDEASMWVQKMGLWTTESDWKAWLASGEKRTNPAFDKSANIVTLLTSTGNPYLPNDPEKYYGKKWRGWAHFLTGKDER